MEKIDAANNPNLGVLVGGPSEALKTKHKQLLLHKWIFQVYANNPRATKMNISHHAPCL
jgi:hypothetical protein